MNLISFKKSNNIFVSNCKKIVFIVILFFTFQTGYSQDDNVEIISHKVELGETMLMVAKKYLVQPTEIYKLNKNAINGISEGMILYIPQPIKSQEILTDRKEEREKEKIALQERKKEREDRELAVAEQKAKEEVVIALEEGKKTASGRREEIGNLKISDKNQFIDHEVTSGQTLSELSRKYGVSIEEIEKANAKVLKNGLQIGQTLKMPVAQNLFIDKTPAVEIIDNGKTEINHKVVSGETLFSIARKYSTSVSDVQDLNEAALKNGLQAGQVLKIIANDSNVTNEEIVTSENNVESSLNIEYNLIKHKVEHKETLYSISRKYNVSVDEIKSINESILTKGLQAGQEISIRVKK